MRESRIYSQCRSAARSTRALDADPSSINKLILMLLFRHSGGTLMSRLTIRGVSIAFIIAILFSHPLTSASYMNNAPLKIDCWGFIDKKGNLVIKPKFDNAADFSEGLAAVRANRGLWGFIDRTGDFVIPPQYDWAESFSEGLALVKLGDKYGYIDKTQRFIIEPQFRFARDFSEGLAFVQVFEGKFGAIDKTGNMVISPQFDFAVRFSEGLAAASIDGKTGFIDKMGTFVITPAYKFAYEFSEGLAAVEFEFRRWGYIDTTGKLVIDRHFDFALSFSEGLALVGVTPSFFYIDKAGQKAINGDYPIAGSFSEGLADIVMYDVPFQWHYINKKGKRKIKGLRYNSVRRFSEGLAAVLTYPF